MADEQTSMDNLAEAGYTAEACREFEPSGTARVFHG
jgi:hypothetical protein